MTARTYYIRHSEDCEIFRDLKKRIREFVDQSKAGCMMDFCTGSGCRVRPVPIIFLVPDPYWYDSLKETEVQ